MMRGVTSSCPSSDDALATALPFSAIPGPSKQELPFFGSLFPLIKEKDGYHVFIEKMHQQFGDIIRYSVMGKHSVSVSRPDHIKEIYTTNQSAPLRESLEPWSNYRLDRGLPLGVALELNQVAQDEERWRKYRRPIAKLLRPEIVNSYVDRVSYVGLDLADTFEKMNQQEVPILELRKITSAFGFEAICAILMGKRMCVLARTPDEVDPRTRRFMDAVNIMFRVSNKMLFGELPFWKIFNTQSKKEHDRAWDDIFQIGGEIFSDSVNDKDPRFVRDGVSDFFDIMFEDEKEDVSSTYTDIDRAVMGIELISGGVDTTSNAAQWILHILARNPEIQERLAQTLEPLMGPLGKPARVTSQVIASAKLYNFVDEALRLHPVLPTGSRMFNKELVFCGYKIPPFTSIQLNNWVASRDPRNFKNPEQFDETRMAKRECPFGSKTFGAGARQCPGERLARMELAVLLGTIVHQFKIETTFPSDRLKATAHILLSPHEHLKSALRFIRRQ